MLLRLSPLLLVISALLAPGGSALSTQPPPRPKPVEERAAFAPGETLTYDVSWSGYVTAGAATTQVREIQAVPDGSSAYLLVAEGRPAPWLAALYTVYYRVESLLDTRTLVPYRSSVHAEEGRRTRTRITTFDPRERAVTYEVQTSTVVNTRVPVPAGTLDGLSALYVLRTRPLAPGTTITMPIVESGETYTARIAVGDPEPVATGIGRVTALRLTPQIFDAAGSPALARRLAMWITTGARRLPVRIQAELAVGTFEFTLQRSSD